MPTTVLTDEDFENGNALLTAVMVKTGLSKSRGEARRVIEQGGLTLNDEKVTEVAKLISKAELENGAIIIKKGKKSFHKITL